MSRIDFLGPPGAAALYPPDSLSWQIYKNPISACIGGVAAVLLQLAEPRVRSGIWSHSSFSSDALARIRRTAMAALATIYAPADAAAGMIGSIVAMHERVRGVTPAGVPYRANDPVLLDWVQATVSFGFMEAYACFVRALSDAERDRFYAESAASARLFGAHGAPRSLAAQRQHFEALRPQLEPHPIVHEFTGILCQAPLLPRPLRPLQELLLRGAVSVLPEWAARRLELRARWRLRSWQKQLLQGLSAIADHVPLIHAPPAQACRRLGLPASYLYWPQPGAPRLGAHRN